jgi:hypothetical protein
MHWFPLRCETSLLLIIALLLGAELAQSAKAHSFYEVFGFSFSNTLGSVSGTAAGTMTLPIACAVACTNQSAVDLTAKDFPAGLGSVVCGPPHDSLPRAPLTKVYGKSFSVTDGEITDADLFIALIYESGGLFYDGDSLAVVAMPEPGSWAFGLGLNGLAWLKISASSETPLTTHPNSPKPNQPNGTRSTSKTSSTMLMAGPSPI